MYIRYILTSITLIFHLTLCLQFNNINKRPGRGCGIEDEIKIVNKLPPAQTSSPYRVLNIKDCSLVRVLKDNSDVVPMTAEQLMTIVNVSNSGSSSISAPCFEEEINYFGEDIVFLSNILTTDDCQIACAGQEGCTHFTYDVSNKICYLKNGNSGPVAFPDHVSGPAVCP
jgi:hypothetical protein